MKKNIIGVLGGMGPQASIRLCDLIINKTIEKLPNLKSGDFPEIILDSIPVPDFITSKRNFNKTKVLLQNRVKKMNVFGINTFCIACNTAHLFLPDLVDLTKANFVSIVDEVIKECESRDFVRVGLFASPNSIRCGLYRKIETTRVLITPSKETINRLDEFIRLTISGKITSLEKKEFNNLCGTFFRDNKLDVLILGCTELPLIFKNSRDVKVIDTIELLACRIVDTIK